MSRGGPAPSPLAGRDGLLLDLDGVVYAGSSAIPGAATAVSRTRADGLPVRFVTNNASRTPEAVATKLRQAGVAASGPEVVTSAQVAAGLLAERLGTDPGPVAVVGGAGLHEALAAAGLRPVRAVDVRTAPAALVQGFDPDTCWADLAAAARWLQAGVPWLATNLDLTIPLESAIAPGNGALVRAVATAAGRDPDDVAGKPSPAPFVAAARSCGARRPVVVGDRLDTDVAGGRAAGALTILVLTGVHGLVDAVAAPPAERPDLVLADLGGLHRPAPVAGPPVPAGAGRTVVRCGPVSASWTTVAGFRLAGEEGGEGGVGRLRGEDLVAAAQALLVLGHELGDRGAAAPGELARDPVVREVDAALRPRA